jgi:hypothetical protein
VSRRGVPSRFAFAEPVVAISGLIDANAEIVPLADGFRIYTPDPGRLAQ